MAPARTLPLLLLGLSLGLSLGLPPGPARAASFACAEAETPDETAICRTLALNDLDVEMAVRFAILKDLLPMGHRGRLQDDQEAWLAERRACAADVPCLTQAYGARLTVLRGVLAEFAKQGPQ